MLALTRRLPALRGAGVAANILKRLYLRKQRKTVDADVLGFRMRLEPSECVDGGLLFYPQLYEHREIAYLRRHLRTGDVFLDLGANIGFYSLVASKLVGKEGLVLAIEADPYNWEKLFHNVGANGIDNVRPLNLGLSDKHEVLQLGIGPRGSRGESGFLTSSLTHVPVECHPLLEVVRRNRIGQIAGLKADIEGFEYRVLKRYLADAEPSLYPRFVIIEQIPTFIGRAGGDAIQLLNENGYKVRCSWKLNHIMELM